MSSIIINLEEVQTLRIYANPTTPDVLAVVPDHKSLLKKRIMKTLRDKSS